MPSGMNEDNALQHVMKRAMEEQSLEIADDDESVGKVTSISVHVFIFFHVFIFLIT